MRLVCACAAQHPFIVTQFCAVIEFGEVLVAPLDASALSHEKLLSLFQRGVRALIIRQQLHGWAKVRLREKCEAEECHIGACCRLMAMAMAGLL